MSFKGLSKTLSSEVPKDPSTHPYMAYTSKPPSQQPQPRGRPCTGATYTILATTHGYGSFSNIDELPRRLATMHLFLFPATPRADVTAVFDSYRNDMVLTANQEARLLKVRITVRAGAWGVEGKRVLVESTYQKLLSWKGKKAEKTDIVVQIEEIRDWETVMRNGRWGMWDGDVPALDGGKSDAEERDVAESVAGMSVADSERTLVG